MSPRRDVLVLCYHAVSPTWPVSLAISPDRLQRQIAWLLERGYRHATFRDAVLSPPAAKTFAVTFDDGFRNVLVHGLPALSRLGVTATIFPSIEYIDSQVTPRVGPDLQQWIGSAHEPDLHPMSWDELRKLSEAGWEIGSHTMTHPYLTRLEDSTLAWELEASRERLEHELQRPCLTLAYPSGDFDKRVAEAAGTAGYEAACTLPARFPARRDPLEWPRISVDRDDGFLAFRVKVSRTVRVVRCSPLWVGLEKTRRVFGRVAPDLI